MKRLLTAIVGICLLPATSVFAEDGEYTHAFTPEFSAGVAFNADTNHPSFTGSLRLMLEVGKASDLVGFNVGAGYRGFFDREPPVDFLVHPSFSDYLLYSREDGHTKRVRPMGGQLIFPAEMHLRVARLGEDTRLFLGCGVEYATRLYQSQRYGDYYGAHIMNANSLAYYPMLGVDVDLDGGVLHASLYWRRYAKRPFNYEMLPIDKFKARDYIGFQIYLAF